MGTGKRGVFAKVDIPQGAMISQEKSSNSVHFPPTTTDLIYLTAAFGPHTDKKLAPIVKMFEAYSFESSLFVSAREYCRFAFIMFALLI